MFEKGGMYDDSYYEMVEAEIASPDFRFEDEEE